jgi:hypothetical protein
MPHSGLVYPIDKEEVHTSRSEAEASRLSQEEGVQAIMHPAEPSQAHRGTGNGLTVPDARKDTLSPVTSTRSYQTTKNPISSINITVTRLM